MHKIKGVDSVYPKYISRLIDWLRAKGISDTDIIECIQYISKDKK